MSEPRLDRAVTLEIQGDIGLANLHRSAGWIASQVLERTGDGTRVGVWTGLGWRDNVEAVATGQVDMALATPASFVAMALEGKGPFDGTPYPELRALGSVPQFDRLVLAVRADLGIRSVGDLLERKPALRVTTPEDDPVNFIGWGAHRLMEAIGISDDVLRAWGGEYVAGGRSFEQSYPGTYVRRIRDGEADAVIQEAIMLPEWQDVGRDPGLSFVPLDETVLAQLEQEHGWPRAEVPAGYFPGQDEPFTTMDFADFLVFCRADLEEDLAHLVAWCMGETRGLLEAGYRHIPPERSPVTYPLDRVRMGDTPVPLHPGAKAYYDSLGS